MGVFDWLFKRSSEEDSAPGLSLPPRPATPAWRPQGLAPDQLDAFLKAHKPHSLPPELRSPPPRKDVWGATALKDAASHDALLDGEAYPCLVTTVVAGGEGLCVYRGGDGQPRSFPVSISFQVRSLPMPLTVVELQGRRWVYEWAVWFPSATVLPPLLSVGQAAQLRAEGSPVHLIDVRRGAVMRRTPIPGSIEHPIESWDSQDEKRGLVTRLAGLSGFEVSLLVDEEPARASPRVPPVEELRGHLESAGRRASLVSALDGGYPAYVHAMAPQLPCFCEWCVLKKESEYRGEMLARSSASGRPDGEPVPGPFPDPEEMARRVRAMPAGQLPPELRRLPAGSVSRAVVVHKEHKEDNEGIDYIATYAWLDGAGELRWETVQHGWEGHFGQSSFVARLREGDVLHVVREAGAEHLHERELITQMGKTPFRGKW